MAFEFKFASLLKYRKRQEDAAQREYLAARRELDDCLMVIHQYYQSVEKARQEIASLQMTGEVGVLSTILSLEQFIEGQKIRIQQERFRARELMARVEDKQEDLIEATREYKKIDKLKDRMHEDYRKERRRREAKQVDDLVVIRGKRRMSV